MLLYMTEGRTKCIYTNCSIDGGEIRRNGTVVVYMSGIEMNTKGTKMKNKEMLYCTVVL